MAMKGDLLSAQKRAYDLMNQILGSRVSNSVFECLKERILGVEHFEWYWQRK